MIFTNTLLTTAMGQLFEYLAARFEEDIIDELKDKGYKQINELEVTL